MPENPDINTVVPAPRLVTDVNASVAGMVYTYARGLSKSSKEGDLGTGGGNEPSNLYCFSAPYPIVGIIPIPDGRFFVCSGDGVNSEVGVADETTCTYQTLNNNPKWNFSPQYPVMGVAKKDFMKDTIVTFTDKNSHVRRVEFKKLPTLTDFDSILLFKKISRPTLKVSRGSHGNVPNGTYSVALAYVVDDQIFSDWYSITPRIQLHSDTGANSLEIEIENLDTEFKEFSLVVVSSFIDPETKGATKAAKVVGQWSTRVKKVSLTDYLNPSYRAIELSQLVLSRRTWLKAGIISANSNTLFLADLVGREEVDYQLKAMQIKAEYVVKQVPVEYYEDGGEDISYYRDENYDFRIRGVWNTGETTDGAWHIPGRPATANDLSLAGSADVYEYDTQFKDCKEPGKVSRWQVQNTAGALIPYNQEFRCNERLLGYGKMGYHQSTEPYPDNKEMFGTAANTPIRLHRMPDESIVPRYQVIGGKTYINILGVRFKDIPAFDDPDIVGYEILRSDRKGGNGTVVARGLITNVRSYTDNITGDKVLFSNYPVNDLHPDQFLSATQTSYKANKEHDFTPLTEYSKSQFNFYSPHTLFEPRYSLGTELKIEAEEVADVKGKFELVHQHPKQKLMNQFAFWMSAATGFIETTLMLLGRTEATGKSILSAKGVTAGVEFEFDKTYSIKTVDDLVSLDVVGYIRSMVKAGAFDDAFSAIKVVLQTIAALAIKIPFSILQGIRQADETLEIIYNFTGYTDYVYQYNAYAQFNRTLPVTEGNRRRRLLTTPTYLPSDVVSIRDSVYNNYFREKTVHLELNHPIADPSTKDTTRNTMSGFGICEGGVAQSTGAAFYATSKVTNPNQYGTVGSAPAVAIHTGVLSGDITPVLFGGDCIITRFQFQKRMQFFNQNIAGTNYPNGTEFDYRLYRNIAYPRYWMDSTKYDFSQLVSSNVINFTKFSRTTTSKHNLDCKKANDGKSITRIDDAHMYLSNNAVLDFIVECDYNINFREKTDQPFYSKTNTNLSQIFRQDRLSFDEEFRLNRVYADIYTTEVFAQQQRHDFDAANKIPADQPNGVIYSLESFSLQQGDNWQYFLPANWFQFKESDFGRITGIHPLDQDRLIFLFSKASPYVSMGKSLLQLSNQTVSIGDGGLFAQDPREIMPTDNNYGSCNSRWAFSNTHLGRFYPSASQGRLMNFTEGLNDFSREGMFYWCQTYMPIQLYSYFPSYPKEENPVGGVGYLTVFDSASEVVYITKRDFIPKPEYKADITYTNGKFFYKTLPIDLRSNYFFDCSWTLSYSPTDKGFVSWHDWHPDGVVQTENHFLVIKGNAVYKHNERTDSFCNFFGKDYPFEIEAVDSTGQTVVTSRNLEYFLEVYTYKNEGRNRFHVHHENFDHLLVHNSEQISPVLKLHLGNPNPEQNQDYPKRNATGFDITFFKEENKYRINQFWDSVKDRGEFTNAQFHLLATDASGYRSVVNPVALALDKPVEERKKFRHYATKFRLTKAVSGPYKFIFKFLNIKHQLSS